MQPAWDATHPHYDLTLEDLFDENPSADFAFWSRIAGWSVDEATALSSGLDPNLVDWGKLVSPDHPFTHQYESRRDLALRAVEMGQLQNFSAPIDYIRWCKKVGIKFNPDLEKIVKARGGAVQRAVNEHPGPKVLTSLLKIALGMVMAFYGFDPKEPDHSTYQEIADEFLVWRQRR